MGKITQPILHHAEEYGQSRQYARQEAIGLFVLAVLVGLWTGLSVMVVGAAYFLYTKHGFWTAFFSLAIPVGVLAGSGWVIVKGAPEQLDGLRSYRQATTYQPMQPQPETKQLPSPWRPPVPARHQGGTTFIDMNERPALPDGRQAGLALNPPTVGAILREIVERHDGQWSRDRLMSIRVDGKRVTRKLYEKLTYYLAEGGFLQERSTGGFEIPKDVASYEDITRYLPSLAKPEGGNPTGTAGRTEGRPERGGNDDTQPADRGVNTGELLCRKFIELECNTAAYLEWRKNHDG